MFFHKNDGGFKMGNIKVKGGKNTSGVECDVCGSWFTHWKKLAGKTDEEVYCCHTDHPASAKVPATIGAHVVKVPKTGDYDAVVDDYKGCGEKFIIPVCECHNITDSKNIEISEDLLMSAEPCTEK
jgi:hypothetical protein